MLIGDEFEYAEYRFLWSSTIAVTRVYDDGIPRIEEIESIDSVDFSIVELENTVYMRVLNPGRNLKALFNTLELLAGTGFSCRPVVFSKTNPSEINEYVDASKLLCLRVSDLALGNGVLAKMEFSSKDGIRISEIQVLKKKRYRVVFSMHEFVYKGTKGQVSMSAGGLVKVSGNLAPKLLDIIESRLVTIGS